MRLARREFIEDTLIETVQPCEGDSIITTHNQILPKVPQSVSSALSSPLFDSIIQDIGTNFHQSQIVKFVDGFYTEINQSIQQQSTRTILNTLSKTPTGNEQGKFLVVDVGGTTLRISAIELHQNSKYSIYGVWKWPSTSGNSKLIDLKFFQRITDCIHNVITKKAKDFFGVQETVQVGISWSSPFTQTKIDNAFVTVVSKGYELSPETFDKDIVTILREQLVDDCGYTVEFNAVTNDAVSVYTAGRYLHNCQLGLVLGTGINSSFMINGKVVNSELSFFGSYFIGLLNQYVDRAIFDSCCDLDDQLLHMSSELPLVQPLEFMTSGLYLGEMTRIALIAMIEATELFAGQSVNKQPPLYTNFGITGAFVCKIIETDYESCQYLFDTEFNLSLCLIDYEKITRLINLLISRASVLVASVLIACGRTIKEQNNDDFIIGNKFKVGCVGSFFEHLQSYRTKVEQILHDFGQEYGEPEITLIHIPDSTILGAAIACAI